MGKLEEIMKKNGYCETCGDVGYFDCDCPKVRKNGPKSLQVAMAQVDYELDLAGGD
ncbi:MAG: hypothetical protein GTN80_03180 [Nitrososphaeria archaeon]|nr:hypothetical protein [Nitrososphaeria archaeon]NIN52183.1 hypothetical protein [Nitrososphaeria archaeon]NIQ32636.1 hypothetical protein [Nitrososphaeria archaeon]